ncbi:hypothetical protein EVAR_19721_1 [Eumeta japonica]|uniref:Uncharacterized protein n=1 Tax=Eumeta variegata TaxID=151549 RepID=A0A4C1UR38_EUMVA|nr:hypothetical protein EVAR_19721_1 [Eumeta japonica]
MRYLTGLRGRIVVVKDEFAVKMIFANTFGNCTRRLTVMYIANEVITCTSEFTESAIPINARLGFQPESTSLRCKYRLQKKTIPSGRHPRYRSLCSPRPTRGRTRHCSCGVTTGVLWVIAKSGRRSAPPGRPRLSTASVISQEDGQADIAFGTCARPRSVYIRRVEVSGLPPEVAMLPADIATAAGGRAGILIAFRIKDLEHVHVFDKEKWRRGTPDRSEASTHFSVK